MPGETIKFEGRFLPEQEKTYVYLPFDVPSHATRLDVSFEYSHRIGSDPLLTGGNTIDLGIFDARGIAFLTAGMRGWSGSERSSFSIGETDATPGYLPGAIIPGEWNIFLGLYKIAVDGCGYNVTITITTEPEHPASAGLPEPVRTLPSSPPLALFSPWLRGELHCHTTHSDGDTGPAGVVRLARERGLDFLAITDHNTVSSQRELAALRDPGIILIQGLEVTTFKGHFGAWGIGDWVDWRVQTAEDMAAVLDFAREHGAVTCCNHPKPFGPPWSYDSVENYDCIEVWNGPWTLLNQMALDLWVRQLAKGRRVAAVGGSDWHRQHQLAETPPRAPGTPTTWLYVSGPPGPSQILEAIRQGRVSLSDEPGGPFLDLRAGPGFSAVVGDTMARSTHGPLDVRVRGLRGRGYRLQLLDQQGTLLDRALAEQEETVTTQLAAPDSLYIRAELRDENEQVKALTNPIYLENEG